MRKKEMRETEVGYCDFCGDEAPHLDTCMTCGRDMCNKDGGATHSAYSLEIFRYEDRNRTISRRICKECADVVPSPPFSISDLFDAMLVGDVALKQDATGELKRPDDPDFNLVNEVE